MFEDIISCKTEKVKKYGSTTFYIKHTTWSESIPYKNISCYSTHPLLSVEIKSLAYWNIHQQKVDGGTDRSSEVLTKLKPHYKYISTYLWPLFDEGLFAFTAGL